jgi:hypothetical protein
MWEGVDHIHLSQYRDQWWAFVKTVTNHGDKQMNEVPSVAE